MSAPKPCMGYPSQRAAARAYGVADSTLIRYMQRNGSGEGLGTNKPRPPIPPETRLAILEAASRGLTAGQIGMKLKISKNSAQGVVRRHREKQNGGN